MLDYLSWLWDFVNSGIYEFFVEWMAYFAIKIGSIVIAIIIFLVTLLFSVVSEVFVQLGLQELITQALLSVDSAWLNLVNAVHGIEVMLMVFNAKVTRYILSIFGF